MEEGFKGNLDEDSAYRVSKAFIDNLVVKIVSQDDIIDEAFKISLKHRCIIYDSLYIALAKKINLELITSDIKLRDIAKKEDFKGDLYQIG